MAVVLLPVNTRSPFGLRSCPSFHRAASTSSTAAFGITTSDGGDCKIRVIDPALEGPSGWCEQKKWKHNRQKKQELTAKCGAEAFAVVASENWQNRNACAGEALGNGTGIWGVGKELGVARRSTTTKGGRSSRIGIWQGEASAEAEAEVLTTGGDDGGVGDGEDGNGSGGGGGDGYSSGDSDAGENEGSAENRSASLAALATVGRSIDSLPGYFATALEKGKIPPAVLERFLDLEKTTFRKWLMRFAGFRERLLADDLFMTKVGIECGVGVFTKTAAEYERRRENFVKELDFVVADILMALVADFMLVWLPAPTVSLSPALAKNANALARYLANCPDNAFQVALRGTSYSTLQRVGAIVRNGAKLLVVGTSASLLGTGLTNGLIKVRQLTSGKKEVVEEAASGEHVDVPILETSLAYGVYMSVSSNLRYQLLAGVVEQRILEPMLGRRKFALGACSFAVRTGNTFLGSLLWVDYARFVGVQ